MATSSESIAPIPVHWFLITVPPLWAEIWEEEGGLPLHALLRVCTVKDLVSDAQKIGKNRHIRGKIYCFPWLTKHYISKAMLTKPN